MLYNYKDMKVAEQKILLSKCKEMLTLNEGKEVEQQFEVFFSYEIKGSLGSAVITLPKAKRVANKGFIYIYCKVNGNNKMNCFIEDVVDFRLHLDKIYDVIYSDEEIGQQVNKEITSKIWK